MNVIQQLETLGQSGSIKQFSSVSEMLKKNHLDSSFINTISLTNKQLICFIEPDDDDDEDSK